MPEERHRLALLYLKGQVVASVHLGDKFALVAAAEDAEKPLTIVLIQLVGLRDVVEFDGDGASALEDIGHLLMRAPVDHQRDQQRDDEHHDKANNGLRLVPNPHLVVHRATVHRDNERDGIEHKNELHQRQLQVVHIEE